MTTAYDCILKACRDSWDESFVKGFVNRDNCSGFLKAVAKKLGVPVDETAVADGLVDLFAADPESWTPLASGAEAARAAETGTFVVAGLRSDEHRPKRGQGHVVIVVPGPLYRSLYPTCWGGSTGGAQSKGTKSVGEVWNRVDRDAVRYWGHHAAVCR